MDTNAIIQTQSTSPIDTLPNELLNLVFEYCVSPSYSTPLIHRISITLSHVCSRWRFIVLFAPQLWTQVHIQSCHKEIHQKLAEYTQWLTRSGSAPLSVSVSLNRSEPPTTSEVVMHFLLPYLPRVEHLDLTVHKASFRVLQQYTGDLPLLKSVALNPLFSTEDESLPSVPPTLVRNVPCLTKLDMIKMLPLNVDRRVFGQLRYFHCVCSGLSVISAYVALKHCANAETLFISVNDAILPLKQTGIIQPLLRPCLTTLNLQYFSADVELIQAITAPNLRELVCEELGHPGDENHNLLAQVLQLVQRSSCALTRLRLRLYSINEEELVSLLNLTPHLELLDLHHALWYRSQSFTDTLANHLKEGHVLPHLERLLLVSRGSLAMSDSALIDLIKGRMTGVKPIKLFQIWCNEREQTRVRALVQDLGLDVPRNSKLEIKCIPLSG